MSKLTIEVGDRVNIYFVSSGMLFDCKVLYTPQDAGDCWHIRDRKGKLHYIQSFESMILYEEAPNA